MKNRESAVNPFQVDDLESRRLLSHGIGGFAADWGGAFRFGGFSHTANTIEFTQAPAAVQQGLDNLATKDGLAAPASDSTQTIYLNNLDGLETYSMTFTSAGSRTQITVDQTGNPVTQPTKATTTWGTLSGSGDGSNAAASAEISTIATALNLTPPTAATVIRVSTAASGVSTFSVRLSDATSGGWWHPMSTVVTVDSNGNPVGNESLPFTAMPTAIQNGINANLPSGQTALDSASTKSVRVHTVNGATTYSVAFNSTGTRTTVTVDASGNLAKLPSRSADQFQNVPQAAQTELQALATAAGVSDPISTTQNVTVYDEANGTTIYAVRLMATKTTPSGKTHSYSITIAVDQNGNPTTVPQQDQGFARGLNFGGGGFGFGGFFRR